jgi:acyl-CoA synthetase (NDP forming)
MTPKRLPNYAEAARRAGKPVILLWLTEWLEGPGAVEFEACPDVVLFRSMDRAFRAIAAWQRHYRRFSMTAMAQRRTSPPDAHAKAAAIIKSAVHEALTEREAKQVLACYGIGVVDERQATDADEAALAAAGLGMPVVLKLESPDVLHKTEAGVIRMNLVSEAEVRAAFHDVMRAAGELSSRPHIEGVLIQPQLPAGVEILIGGRVDPLLGPLVMVGIGGVLVELIKDSRVALAPVTPTEALRLVQDLKSATLFDGFRGGPAVSREAVAAVVSRVSEVIADHAAHILELDVNPLICAGERIVAVDAVIVLKHAEASTRSEVQAS